MEYERKTYEVLGGSYTLSELSRKTGVKLATICKRLSRGRSIEDAVTPGRLKMHRTKYKYSVEVNGELQSLYSLAKESGVNYRTALDRFKAGKPLNVVLDPMPKYSLEYNGKHLSLSQWGRDRKISYFTLKWRYTAGWTPEEILGYKKREKHEFD